MSSRLTILDVAIDNLTWGQTLERLKAFIEEGGPHHVVTVNPEYLVMARENGPFREVLQKADLALADGAGLAWAAWFLGRPLVERIPGVDLVRALASLSAQRGYRLFLLGAAPGVAEAAARVLAVENSGLTVVGCYAGSPTLAEEEAIVARVRQASPHILLVAYGAPAQDLWIHRQRASLGVPLALGVGGAFDYISGRVKRAPLWMRRLGLEWLYRLYQEPWRWRRMLRLPRFVGLVLVERFRRTHA